jgi:hypothetical protein
LQLLVQRVVQGVWILQQVQAPKRAPVDSSWIHAVLQVTSRRAIHDCSGTLIFRPWVPNTACSNVKIDCLLQRQSIIDKDTQDPIGHCTQFNIKDAVSPVLKPVHTALFF